MAGSAEKATASAEPKWHWTRQQIAGLFGLVLAVGGLIGLGVVATYWGDATACPTFPHQSYCIGPPAPLTVENSTLIIVGSTVSVVFLTVGVIIGFIALYFPVSDKPQ